MKNITHISRESIKFRNAADELSSGEPNQPINKYQATLRKIKPIFCYTFIPDISIAPLQVQYYSVALPTQH